VRGGVPFATQTAMRPARPRKARQAVVAPTEYQRGPQPVDGQLTAVAELSRSRFTSVGL